MQKDFKPYRKISSHIVVKGKRLTGREMEFIYYLIHGMTAKQIARVIGLSHRSVESGIFRLKKKLNCNSRYEIISLSFTNDLFLKQLLQLYKKDFVFDQE